MGQGVVIPLPGDVARIFPTRAATGHTPASSAEKVSVSHGSVAHLPTAVSSPRRHTTPRSLHLGHSSSTGGGAGGTSSEGSGALSKARTPRSAVSSLMSRPSRGASPPAVNSAQLTPEEQRQSLLDEHHTTIAPGGGGRARRAHHLPFLSLSLHPGGINKAAATAPGSRSSSGARPEGESAFLSSKRSSAFAMSPHQLQSEMRDAALLAAAERTATLPAGELDCIASGFLSISDYGFIAESLKTLSVFMLADMGITNLGQPSSDAGVAPAAASPRHGNNVSETLAPQSAGTAGSAGPMWAAMRDALVAGKRGVPRPRRHLSLMDATMTMINGDSSAAAAAAVTAAVEEEAAAIQALIGGSTTPGLFHGPTLDGDGEGDAAVGRSTATLAPGGENASCAGHVLGASRLSVPGSTTGKSDELASTELASGTVTFTATRTTLTGTESDLLSAEQIPAAVSVHPSPRTNRLLTAHSPPPLLTSFAPTVASASPPPLSMSDLTAIAEQDEVLDMYLRTLATRVRGITSKLRVMTPRAVLRFFLMSALASTKGHGMAKLLPVTAAAVLRPSAFANKDEAETAEEAAAAAVRPEPKREVWILRQEVVLPSMSAEEVRTEQVRSDALAAMGHDLVRFFKDTKVITLRYMLLFANAMPLSINSRLNHHYMLPNAAILESYVGCGVHTRRSKDFFVSLTERVALLGVQQSFGTPEYMLLAITQVSNLASQIMSSFAIGAVLGCTSRWRALHEAGVTSSEELANTMELFAKAYCAGHDLLMNEAFPALRKQYPNVFIISSYVTKEEDGGRPPMMTVAMSTLMKLIFLFSGGLESIRADDRRMIATAMREGRMQLEMRMSTSSRTSRFLTASDTGMRTEPPTTTAAAAARAATGTLSGSVNGKSGALSLKSFAPASPLTAPPNGLNFPSWLPQSLSSEYGSASGSSSMPHAKASRAPSPSQSGCVQSASGHQPAPPPPPPPFSPMSQTATASTASPRSSCTGPAVGRDFRLSCIDSATGEACCVGDDVALSVALHVPSASLIVGLGEVLLSGPLAQNASLEDTGRAARALSRVWRVLFQNAALLPFGPACPLEMADWLPLFPLYVLNTDAKRVMLTVYAKSIGQVPLAFGPVQREDAVTSSAHIARALYRTDKEKESQLQPGHDSGNPNVPSALSLGTNVANAGAAAAAATAPAAATTTTTARSHLICPTFTVTPGGAAAAHVGVGHANSTNGKAHHNVPASPPRLYADATKAQRKELYDLCARQCADLFLPGVNLTKQLHVFALPGGVAMLRPEKLVDPSPAQAELLKEHGDCLTLLVSRRRASMHWAGDAVGSSNASAAASSLHTQQERALSVGGVPTAQGDAVEVHEAPVREGDEIMLRWGEPSRSRSPATTAAAATSRSSVGIPGSFVKRWVSAGARRGHSAAASPHHLTTNQPWAPVAALFSAQEVVGPNKSRTGGGVNTGVAGGDRSAQARRSRFGNKAHSSSAAAAAVAAPATRTATATIQDDETGAPKEEGTVSGNALPTSALRTALMPRRTCSTPTARGNQQQQPAFSRRGTRTSGGSGTLGAARDAAEAAEVTPHAPIPPTRRSRVCLVLHTTDPNYHVVVLDTPNCVAGCVPIVSEAIARASLGGSTTTAPLALSQQPSTSSSTASATACVPSVTGVVLYRRQVAPLALLQSSACAWTNADFVARLCGADESAAKPGAPLPANSKVPAPCVEASPPVDGASPDEWAAVPEVLGWLLGQALGNDQTFTLPLPPLAFRILAMADRLELPMEEVTLTTADASLLHPDLTNSRLRERLLATLVAMYLRPDPGSSGADGESPRGRETGRGTTMHTRRTLTDDGCVSGSHANARRQYRRLKKELEDIAHAMVWSVPIGNPAGCALPGRHFWAAVLRGMRHSPLLDTPLFAQCCARTVHDVLCGPYDRLEDDLKFHSSFVLLVVDDTTVNAAGATSAGGGGGEGYKHFVCKSVLRVLDELPLRERRVLLRFITGNSLRTRRSQMNTLHLVVQRGFSSMPARRVSKAATAPAAHSATFAFGHFESVPLMRSIMSTATMVSTDAPHVPSDAESCSQSNVSLQKNAAVETVVRTCVDGTMQLLPTGHPGTNTLVIPNYFEALLMGSYRRRVLGAELPPLKHGAAASGTATPMLATPMLKAHPFGVTAGSSDATRGRIGSSTPSSVPAATGATPFNGGLSAAAARVAAGSPLAPVFDDAELQQAWVQLTENQQEMLRRRYRELLRHRLRAALYVYLMSHSDTVAEAWELGPQMGFIPNVEQAPAAGDALAEGAATTTRTSGAFMHRPDGTVVYIEREFDDPDGEGGDGDDNVSSAIYGDADGFVNVYDTDDGASEVFDMFLATTGTEVTMGSDAFTASLGDEDAAAAWHADRASRGNSARQRSLHSDPNLEAPLSLAESPRTPADMLFSDGNLRDYRTAADFRFSDEEESPAHHDHHHHDDDDGDGDGEEARADHSAEAVEHATLETLALDGLCPTVAPELATGVPMGRASVVAEAEAVLAEGAASGPHNPSMAYHPSPPHAPTTTLPISNAGRRRPGARVHGAESGQVEATFPMPVATPPKASARLTPRNRLLQPVRNATPGKDTATPLTPRSSTLSSCTSSTSVSVAGLPAVSAPQSPPSVAALAATRTPPAPSDALLRVDVDTCIRDLFPS